MKRVNAILTLIMTSLIIVSAVFAQAPEALGAKSASLRERKEKAKIFVRQMIVDLKKDLPKGVEIGYFDDTAKTWVGFSDDMAASIPTMASTADFNSSPGLPFGLYVVPALNGTHFRDRNRQDVVVTVIGLRRQNHYVKFVQFRVVATGNFVTPLPIIGAFLPEGNLSNVYLTAFKANYDLDYFGWGRGEIQCVAYDGDWKIIQNTRTIFYSGGADDGELNSPTLYSASGKGDGRSDGKVTIYGDRLGDRPTILLNDDVGHDETKEAYFDGEKVVANVVSGFGFSRWVYRLDVIVITQDGTIVSEPGLARYTVNRR